MGRVIEYPERFEIVIFIDPVIYSHASRGDRERYFFWLAHREHDKGDCGKKRQYGEKIVLGQKSSYDKSCRDDRNDNDTIAYTSDIRFIHRFPFYVGGQWLRHVVGSLCCRRGLVRHRRGEGFFGRLPL